MHVDLDASQLNAAGHFCQMVSEGECRDTQHIRLIRDITIPAGGELVASAITSLARIVTLS